MPLKDAHKKVHFLNLSHLKYWEQYAANTANSSYTSAMKGELMFQ